jgi:hypothetical protein
VDLVGPLKSSEGFNHILTITDAFTQYTELVPIINKQSITVAEALFDEWICRHGFFEQVVSDRGGEFVSEVMKELNTLMKTKHHIISPYSPHINGQIERVHRSMGVYLKNYCENATTEWVKFIAPLRFALNTRVHSSTKVSPFFMTYMEHPIFPWTQDQHLSYSETDIAAKVQLLQYARQLVTSNSDEAKAASKRAFDIKKRLRKFKVGDQVLLHLPTPPPGNNKKFYSPWRGIYTVIERTSDLTYKVRKKGGRVRDTHINRLKYYDPENSIDDEKVHLSNNEDLGTHDTTQTEDTTQTGDTQPTRETTEGRTTRSRSNKLPPPIQRFAAANENYGNHSQPLTTDNHNQNFNARIEPTSIFPPQTPGTSQGAGAYNFQEEDFAFLFQPISKGTQPFQQ